MIEAVSALPEIELWVGETIVDLCTLHSMSVRYAVGMTVAIIPPSPVPMSYLVIQVTTPSPLLGQVLAMNVTIENPASVARPQVELALGNVFKALIQQHESALRTN